MPAPRPKAACLPLAFVALAGLIGGGTGGYWIGTNGHPGGEIGQGTPDGTVKAKGGSPELGTDPETTIEPPPDQAPPPIVAIPDPPPSLPSPFASPPQPAPGYVMAPLATSMDEIREIRRKREQGQGAAQP